MHRLLVWTGKGGTGKTTTVANLAPALAARGYRVLLVGFDPQADLEITFGIDNETETVRVETLFGKGAEEVRGALVAIPLPKVKKGGRLMLLPTSPELNAHMAEFTAGGYAQLDDLLTELDDEFDMAIIDTQGAMTPISQAALRAADSVLFSCEPGFYESRSIVERLLQIDALAEQDAKWAAMPLGILLIRTAGRSRLMRGYREHFAGEEFADVPVFDSFVRQQNEVKNHPAGGKPTILAAPKSNVAIDYTEVANELVARLTAQPAA